MSADVWLPIVLLVVAAITLLLTAAAEAGIVTISPVRTRLLAERGDRHGRALHHAASERAATFAAFTVVRNIALAGGTAALAYLLIDSVNDRSIALLVAFAGAVVGSLLLQLVPQFLVINHLERWALALTPLAAAIRFVFWPIGWVFTAPARLWLRGRGRGMLPPDEILEAEELLRIVEMENGDMRIEADEAEMIRGVIGLDETLAREIMVPRIDIVAVDADGTLEDVMRIIVERGFSRVPTYEETIDKIVGVVYAKDVLKAIAQGQQPSDLRELARPPYFIPEAKKIDDLLREFKQSKVHLAIVVDEYGGTAGLVTIEDLLEEIVGEIEDEYDVAEVNIERVGENEAIVDARVPIDDLTRLFDIEIDSEDFDTVGGLVYTHLGKIPSVGDEVRVNGLQVRILSVDDRRIKKVLVRHVNGAEAEDGEAQPAADAGERVP